MLASIAIQIFHVSLYSTTTGMQMSSDITEPHKSHSTICHLIKVQSLLHDIQQVITKKGLTLEEQLEAKQRIA